MDDEQGVPVFQETTLFHQLVIRLHRNHPQNVSSEKAILSRSIRVDFDQLQNVNSTEYRQLTNTLRH